MRKSVLFTFVCLFTLLLIPAESCEAQVGLTRIFMRAATKAPRAGNAYRQAYRFKPRKVAYTRRANTVRTSSGSRITYGKNYRSYQALKRKYSLNNATKIKLNHNRLGTIKRNQARRALEVRKNRERLLAEQRTAKLNREKQIAAVRTNAAKKRQTAKVVRERKKRDLNYLKQKREQTKRITDKKVLDERASNRKKQTLAELKKRKGLNDKKLDIKKQLDAKSNKSTVVQRTKNIKVSKDAITFFENAKYSPKVLRQMSNSNDIFHGFPKSVDGYATKFGKLSTKVGGDGKTYEWLEVRGNYKGKTGTFEFIKDSNGVINHRFFNED